MMPAFFKAEMCIRDRRIFADVGFEPVERHDIAGGGYPERQVGIAEIGKIGEFHNRFVRHLCRIAMSGIIHDDVLDVAVGLALHAVEGTLQLLLGIICTGYRCV